MRGEFGMPRLRVGAAVAAAALVVLALTGCTRGSGYGYSDGATQAEVSCDDVAASVVQRERTGDTAGEINDELQYLSDNCADAYDIVAGYLSARATPAEFRLESCAEWDQRIRPEAIDLLRQDQLCSDAGAPAGGATAAQPGSIPWDQAVNHAGSTQYVCGPLVNSGTDQDDVFLNLGRGYPDAGRFTIVLWDVGGIEPLSPGTTLCATGPVTLYEGVAEIELYDVGQVEVWE